MLWIKVKQEKKNTELFVLNVKKRTNVELFYSYSTKPDSKLWNASSI